MKFCLILLLFLGMTAFCSVRAVGGEASLKGSSGMMEVEAARVLWRRSVGKHRLRYTTVLSDGDAKTLTELKKIQSYGADVEITKEECVNHISKQAHY